jgi:hypothetical protein
MTVVQHFMHQTKMKKQGLIKSNVMAQLVATNIYKVNQIPYTNVIPPTFEGDDGDDVW